MSKLDSGDKNAIIKCLLLSGLSLTLGLHFGHIVGLVVFFSTWLTVIILSEI